MIGPGSDNYLEVQVELIFEDCRELLAILPLGHLEIAEVKARKSFEF